jgi:hypothetical protein
MRKTNQSYQRAGVWLQDTSNKNKNFQLMVKSTKLEEEDFRTNLQRFHLRGRDGVKAGQVASKDAKDAAEATIGANMILR